MCFSSINSVKTYNMTECLNPTTGNKNVSPQILDILRFFSNGPWPTGKNNLQTLN